MVAFHFQFANQSGWECDACRKSGLERRRRCPWLNDGEEPRRVVWARGTVSSEVCPQGYVTAESAAWVEGFLVKKRLGVHPDMARMTARDVEAQLILEREWAAEMERLVSKRRGGADGDEG